MKIDKMPLMDVYENWVDYCCALCDSSEAPAIQFHYNFCNKEGGELTSGVELELCSKCAKKCMPNYRRKLS